MNKKLLLVLSIFFLIGCGQTSSTPDVTTEDVTTEEQVTTEENVTSEEGTTSEENISESESSITSSSEEFVKQNWDADGKLTILSFGNSFNEDTMDYVYEISSSLGIAEINLGKLYIGGSSIDNHWYNAQNDYYDEGSYEYRSTNDGVWKTEYKSSLLYALEDNDWDFIVFNQLSTLVYEEATYANFENLINFVKNNNPNKHTKYAFNVSWADDVGTISQDEQLATYQKIAENVPQILSSYEDIEYLIPTGTAIQNARTSYLGNNLTRDGHHLSYHEGRYIASLTLINKLLSLSIDEVEYKPFHVDDDTRLVAIESAVNAVNNPYQVTNSEYTLSPKDRVNPNEIQYEKDVILEAEDGVFDHTVAKVFNKNRASGGAGACDFNNCGQGITLYHYSYIAGVHDVEIGYWTGMANSKQSLYLNDRLITTVVYDEANGWASEEYELPNTKTIQLDLVQGWNTISLFKQGTAEDDPSWGGYVMLDYLKIKGTNAEYLPSEFDTNSLTFKIEAEQGSLNAGNLPHSGAPTTASGEFFVGNFDAINKNVVFTFKAPKSGIYDLQIGYAKANNNPKASVHLNNVLVEEVSFDSYANEAWNNFNLNSQKTRITLSSDSYNVIKINNEGEWFCFDYLLLTYVGE